MIPLQIPDLGAAVGPFVRYRTGAVYRGDRTIGHLVGAAPGLDQPGEGCGKLWRSERDPAACREYERVVGAETFEEFVEREGLGPEDLENDFMPRGDQDPGFMPQHRPHPTEEVKP